MNDVIRGEAMNEKPSLSVAFPAGSSTGNALTAIASNKEATQALASIWIAKQFPRDTAEVTRRMRDACSRYSLAQTATYRYRRGSTHVSGGSIRLAETLLSAWGNAEAGWVELSREMDKDAGCTVSLCKAFCFDKENNLYREISFNVRHWRDLKDEDGKKGRKNGYALVDERDIYEMNANQASRRIRACIFQVIPEWLKSEAIEEVAKTMDKGDGRDPQEIFRSLQAEFLKYRITRERLEKFLGHAIEETTRAEIRNLGEIYNSLEDGEARVRDYFPEDIATPKTGNDVIDPFAHASIPSAASTEAPKPSPVEEKQSAPSNQAASNSDDPYSLF